MLNWEERYQLGLTDFDLHDKFHLEQRSNVLIQTVTESQIEDQHDFDAVLCKSGLPNASTILQGHFEIHPNQNLNVPSQDSLPARTEITLVQQCIRFRCPGLCIRCLCRATYIVS